MPQTQDGDEVEQNQIAQFEPAYELRGGLCRFRSHNLPKGINQAAALNNWSNQSVLLVCGGSDNDESMTSYYPAPTVTKSPNRRNRVSLK